MYRDMSLTAGQNGGASGAVSMTEKIPLSDVISSYMKLENVKTAELSELQRIAAEEEEADKKAADLKSAATAAAAARPSRRQRSLSGLHSRLNYQVYTQG